MSITWRQAAGPLRLFLAALFGTLVVFQVMSLPGQALLRQAATLRTDLESVI